jgi:hypothetical protein
MKTDEQIRARMATLTQMAESSRATKTARVIWTCQTEALRWALGETDPDFGLMADLDIQEAAPRPGSSRPPTTPSCATAMPRSGSGS